MTYLIPYQTIDEKDQRRSIIQNLLQPSSAATAKEHKEFTLFYGEFIIEAAVAFWLEPYQRMKLKNNSSASTTYPVVTMTWISTHHCKCKNIIGQIQPTTQPTSRKIVRNSRNQSMSMNPYSSRKRGIGGRHTLTSFSICSCHQYNLM